MVPAAGRRYGFFTDTTVCIGCKACEVACKEWNAVPDHLGGFTGHSYDNTGELGANAWRHVAFVEQPVSPTVGLEWFDQPPDVAVQGAIDPSGEVGQPPGTGTEGDVGGIRLLMSSDVCKHCTSAACVEVCPTGALFYTEFDSVVVQDDICNGCGYCVTACPFGVIERRESDGGAHKCTLCYDRLKSGTQPACAQSCPTDSIQFGPLDELIERAENRLARVSEYEPKAQLYGRDEEGVAGTGALFLLLDDPEHYRLPPDPVTPTRNLGQMWRWAGIAAAALATGVLASVGAGGAGGR
ncbi:4Fe-4S dicluster domain-containing protein [Egibacter rhizosphaerae]|uniref:4Fe-4S dicluster domain-containing protein n=1 Tax=Egibacter rhizosphaerae TaxID=1670831 RepID=A0A411YKY2_9ACTN|nr:4Fe-4S dicluster domain-containing protein [Egibacter rhizosphaerae]